MKKWFYVLELAGGRYYVGISNNVVRRARQHHEGKGAVWTKLHSPVNVDLLIPESSELAHRASVCTVSALPATPDHARRNNLARFKTRIQLFCESRERDFQSSQPRAQLQDI
jgi:hypothetical protein